MKNLNEKLSDVSSGQTSVWKAKAKYRRENRGWLKKSAAIAMRVLDALKSQDLTQKDLAERMDISPQQVSKIVKGHENLTLETISNLERALHITLIEEQTSHSKTSLRKKAA